MIDVSIIIVSWNVKELLKLCIESIILFTKNVNFEIIIVDNDSSDGTKEEISRIMNRNSSLDMIFIENEKNYGFSKANNIGLERARGKFILFLNPDTELLSNSIKEMAQFLEKNHEYGAVGCRLVYPDGTIYHPCARGYPTPINVFYEIMLLRRLFPKVKKFGALGMLYWDKGDSRDVDCLVGACVLVKREVLKSVGSFKDIFFMYGEDIDLCYRIKNGGWKIRYMADFSIIHHTEKSSEQVPINNFKTVMRAESNYLFNKINLGNRYGFYYRLIIFLGAGFRMIVLSLLYLFHRIGISKNAEMKKNTFKKYYKLFRWSIGLENWANNYGN